MKAIHNPESPRGDRGNGPETRPGGEQERMYPQTSEPPKGEPSPFRAGRRSERSSNNSWNKGVFWIGDLKV